MDNILITTLDLLTKKNIPLGKIVLQKIVYFLKDRGVPFSYSFRPFTYGPYSSSLSHALESLCFWDYLEERGNEYAIRDLPTPAPDEDLTPRITAAIDTFASMVDGQYDFKTMEIFGTVISCRRALEEVGEEVTPDSVLAEFKAWKADKYDDDRILAAYRKIC